MKNMTEKRSKIGQVSISIILGIVVLVAIGAIFYIRSQSLAYIATNHNGEEEFGSISGKVVPIDSGAKIQIEQNNLLIAETTIDSNGYYVLTNITPGIYNLIIPYES